MKWLKRFLLAGTSLLAMTGYAAADFIITPIAFGLFAGPLGGALSFGALYTGVQIGLYAVGIGITALAGALGRQKVDPGQYKNTFDSSESSEVNAIGRVALGGLKVFGNTAGTDRYRLIAHAKGPLVAIEEYKLGGREVTVDSDGTVSSPPYSKPGGSWVTWQTKEGDGTETAWPDLTSAFPTLWTSDHRARGIAQSLIKYVSPGIYTEKFGKLYQGGEPAGTIVARMNTAYDPRVVGHDMNNEATWEWTDNGPLCAARIMLSYPDVTVDSFDWDFISAEADRADVLVATKTGTEKRSRCSGVWLSESKRGETMQQVLDSIGAEITTSDAGLIRIRLIDDVPTSEIEFTERDIVEWNWKSGPEAVERPNVCRIQYYSAERNYEMADIDMTGIAWAQIDDEVTRYGEKVFDVELSFCPSASQAQRIARRMFALARADAGVIQTNMSGVAAWGLSYADIEFPDVGESPVCKIAPPKIDDERGMVDIPYVVWPTLTTWTPATDEAAAPEVVPDLQFESELDQPAAPSEATVVEYPIAGTFETRLRFTSVTGATVAEANYRTYTGGQPDAWSAMTEDGLTFAYVASDLSGQVDFRVRFFNADDEGSYFSDLLEEAALGVDNTATAAPVLVGTGTASFDVEVTAPNDLNVAYITIESQSPNGLADWVLEGTFDVQPGDVVNDTVTVALSSEQSISIRAFAHTSDGTASPASNVFFYTAP